MKTHFERLAAWIEGTSEGSLDDWFPTLVFRSDMFPQLLDRPKVRLPRRHFPRDSTLDHPCPVVEAWWVTTSVGLDGGVVLDGWDLSTFSSDGLPVVQHPRLGLGLRL